MKRVKTTLGIVLLSAVLLEIVLQVAAFVVSRTHAAAASTTSGTPSPRSVLCIGDSYTFGVGRSSEQGSYPAQLQAQLRDQLATDWSVTNGGIPGQHSRGALEALPSQLATTRPAWVLIAVGANDRWQKPEERIGADGPPITAPGRQDGFVWRWRTKLVATWAIGNIFSVDNSVGRRIEALQAKWQEGPDERVGLALHRALREAGDTAAHGELATKLVQHFPKSSQVHALVAREKLSLGDIPGAQNSIDRALATLPDHATPLRADLLRTRAFMAMNTDLELAAQSLQQAIAIDGQSLSNEFILEFLDDMTPPETRRICESHLSQMVALCRSAGATPILATYPLSTPRLTTSMQAVAARTGVDCIVIAPEFNRRIAGTTRDQYFIPDGHCTDAGYEVVANILADALATRAEK